MLAPLSSSSSTSAHSALSTDSSETLGPLRNDVVGAAILSAVAGYVDAAGFLALFGFFTAHVTGDIVSMGATFGHRIDARMGVRLLTIPVFMLSVATTTFVSRTARQRGRCPLTAPLALMTVALAAFCASGVVLRSFMHAPDEWAVGVTGAIGVLAMGVENALMRDLLKGLSPATIMTGNLTQLTIDLVELALVDRSEEPDQERNRRKDGLRRGLVKVGTPLLSFLLGTVLGSLITSTVGLWSILLPTAVVGLLTVLSWRGASIARASRAFFHLAPSQAPG